MARVIESLTIPWEGGAVGGRFAPAAGATGVLLAHGAGLGQDHDWMVHVRDGLAAAGIPVLTFDYPYMDGGRKAPNPLRILLACHGAALAALRARVGRVVMAGKSMGGRIGSHLAADGEQAAGLVYYGYPLVAVGKTEPRDVSHLASIGLPMLFVQGTRDRLAPLGLITRVIDGLDRAALHVVEGGDHSFRVPARTGRKPADVLDEVVAVTVRWLEDLG